jgi:site-specific DNA-cytosine methylase
MTRTFSAGFLYCGLGAGALGFLEACGQLGRDSARFVNVGGIDIDDAACADFEYLTGARATRADVSKMTPAELRAAWGERAPDCVFSSPPCKGFSRLLSTKASQTDKYQALNRLVLQGLFLLCESWETPPALLVVENVPGIMSRGAALLAQVRQLLASYGYALHEGTHDCGEIGGLAQHRRRYLLVARLPSKVSAYVYQPPRQKVRACGSVLETLPMPGDESAGALHQLPKLSWLNWVRLALIPAGKDWRALPKDAGELSLRITAARAESWKGRPGLLGVQPWEEPAQAITGSVKVSGGHARAAIADPRVELAHEPRRGTFGVTDWDTPAPTVRGQSSVRQAPAAVADPRIPLASCSDNPNLHHNKYVVTEWDEPARTVIGATRPGSGALSVADPRLFSPVPEGAAPRTVFAKYDVRSWEKPARTVAGSGTNGGFGVADPRIAYEREPFGNCDRVTPWDRPVGTVTHAPAPSSGAPAVADPRLGCKPRAGAYGVLSWWEAASTITGSMQIDNGRASVADPRADKAPPPMIVAEDGTWHRPITTLELAALQGLPARVHGAPLKLAGRSTAKHRERIGNAVPVGAARAIAESLLKALLASALGIWTLGSTGIWVRDDGRSEDELAVEAAA